MFRRLFVSCFCVSLFVVFLSSNSPAQAAPKLVNYIVFNRDFACPPAATIPQSSEFLALRGKTMALKALLATLQNNLDAFAGGADIKKQIADWSGAVKDADAADGKEATVCDAAVRLAQTPATASLGGGVPAQSVQVPAATATSDAGADIGMDKTFIQFASTEVKVAADSIPKQTISVSNRSTKKDLEIKLLGPPRLLEIKEVCDEDEQDNILSLAQCKRDKKTRRVTKEKCMVSEQGKTLAQCQTDHKTESVEMEECDASEQGNILAQCKKDKKTHEVEVDSNNFSITDISGTCTSAMTIGQNCQVQIGFNPSSAGKHAAIAQFDVQVTGESTTKTTIPVNLAGEGYVKELASYNGDGSGSNTPVTRLIMGLDISGTTTSDVQQKYYVEAALNAPVGWSKINRDPLDRGVWWFFNPRITSLPRPGTALSQLNVQGFANFINDSKNKTDLVQGLDVQGGLEFCPGWLARAYLCAKPREGVPFITSYKNMHARMGTYWVAGVGFTTPFASQVNNPTIFSLADANNNFPGDATYTPFNIPNPNFNPNRPNDPNAPQYIASNDPRFATAKDHGFAFVLDDRSRFYRKFYMGLRLKTYHFTDLAKGNCDESWDKTNTRPCEAVHNAYPGVIDLTAGKDEQVTAGHLSNWIFRMDANYPIPFAPYLHLLASLNTSFKKNQTSTPFIPPATSTLPLNSPQVGILAVHRFPDRDLYRIGVGVDLLEIKNALSKKTAPASSQAPADTTKK